MGAGGNEKEEERRGQYGAPKRVAWNSISEGTERSKLVRDTNNARWTHECGVTSVK